MASTNSSWIPVAGLGLVMGLAGGFLGAILLIERVRPSRESGSSPSQPNDESVAVLRDLAGEVRRLREAVELGASSRTQEPGSERAPMEPAGTERLERSIERLAEVLASPGSAVQPRRSVPASPPTALVPKATDRLLAVCAMSPEERGRNYYFWSRQEFLDRFGAPDDVGVQGDSGYNLTLSYKIGEESWLTVSFANDVLYYIECNG